MKMIRYQRYSAAVLTIALTMLSGCQQKTKEKIVYIEVPVEVTSTVEGEKIPGEKIIETVETEKLVNVLTQAETVDEAVVTLTPGVLALSTGISLIPPKANESAAGPSSFRGFSLLRNSEVTTDLAKFEEDIVIWNPAQEPLKNVNGYLCIIGKTAYNQAAALDNLKRSEADTKSTVEVDRVYIAKVGISDCTKRDSSNSGGQQGAAGKKAPADVTVKIYKEKNKPLTVSLWYSVKVADLSSGGTTTGAGTQGDVGSESNDERNFYLHLRVAEPISQENPFGLFDLEGDSYDVKNLVEQSDRASNFYVKVYRKSQTNDLMLNFFDNNKMPVFNGSDWATFIKNQAVAQLDVKAQLDENKQITGYEIKGGDAHTALNYSWAYVGNDPNNMGANGGSDNSGSYSLAFDPDFVITKYNLAPTNYQYGTTYAGFNPEDATCSTRNENWVNVWEYAIFAADGSRISQPNGYMIKTGKTHPEWNYPITGWFSRWGLYLDGVSDGETVQLLNWDSGTETPYIYSILNGKLLDYNWQDITSEKSTNLTLSCSTNCPKAPITQADIDSNSLFLAGPGPFPYTFNAADKTLNYGGQVVKFAAGTTVTGTSFEWQWNIVDSEFFDAGSNMFRYQMSLNQYNKTSALRVKLANGSAGAFFYLPKPIEFLPFSYDDALHSYENNENPAATGRIFDFVYDGYLMGINWEQKSGRKDQWNNDMWAPEITLRRGVELTVAHTTGKVKAGDKVKLVPKVSQHTAKSRSFLAIGDVGVSKNGCSLSLQERALWIKYDLVLPVANATQDTKATIGVKPSKMEDNVTELPVLFTDGEPTKKG